MMDRVDDEKDRGCGCAEVVGSDTNKKEIGMNKNIVMAGLLSVALCAPLAACGGSGASGSGTDTSTSATTDTSTSAGADSSSSFDAASFYAGQWRGSVEITGQTVYGTAGGNEQMLDVVLDKDGTCKVTPLAAHADLLTDTGTWKGTESEVTLTLSKGATITLKVVDQATLSGNAADFGIADFDTINFDFYG